MRAIWKGAVSFGLVSIAVKLYSATEEKDIRFHQVHRADGGRIKYKRTCSICGEEVSYDDIAKGYDLGGGEMVILTDDDFADLPLTTSRAIDVLEFVPAEQVDPILYNKAYYLEPDSVAGEAVRAAARRAGTGRPGRHREGGAAPAGDWPRCACARACWCSTPCCGRTRCARPQLRLPRRGRDGAPAGAQDGRRPDRVDGRRLQAGGVHRRLPRGAATGHRRQDRQEEIVVQPTTEEPIARRST